MPPKKNAKNKNGNGGTLGIENELWEAEAGIKSREVSISISGIAIPAYAIEYRGE